MTFRTLLRCLGLLTLILGWNGHLLAGDGLRVGAAAVNLKALDHMVVAGGIHPGTARGQEGELRAIAIVLEKDGVKLAIVALDPAVSGFTTSNALRLRIGR